MMDFIDDIYIYGGSSTFLFNYFSIARSFPNFKVISSLSSTGWIVGKRTGISTNFPDGPLYHYLYRIIPQQYYLIHSDSDQRVAGLRCYLFLLNSENGVRSVKSLTDRTLMDWWQPGQLWVGWMFVVGNSWQMGGVEDVFDLEPQRCWEWVNAIEWEHDNVCD